LNAPKADSRQLERFVVEKEKDLWNNESLESARIFVCCRSAMRVHLRNLRTISFFCFP